MWLPSPGRTRSSAPTRRGLDLRHPLSSPLVECYSECVLAGGPRRLNAERVDIFRSGHAIRPCPKHHCCNLELLLHPPMQEAEVTLHCLSSLPCSLRCTWWDPPTHHPRKQPPGNSPGTTFLPLNCNHLSQGSSGFLLDIPRQIRQEALRPF